MSSHPRNLLVRSISQQWRSVVPASLLFVSHQIGEALVPVVIGATIDNAISGGSFGDLIRWLLVLIAVFIVLSNSYKYGARAVVRAIEQAAHQIRVAVTARMVDDRGGAEAGRLPGELVSVATSDAQRVGAVNGLVAETCAALGALGFSVVLVLSISVPLGLVVLGGILPLLILTRLLGKVLHARSEAEQEKAAAAAGLATDLVTGLRVLTGIGGQDAAAQRYQKASRASLTATLRAARTDAGMDGAAVLITGIFLAVVALVGGRLTAAGELSVGSLIAVVGVAQFLIGPLNRLTDAASGLARAHASAVRVAAILQAPPAVQDGGGTLTAATGSLQVTGLATTDGQLRGATFDVGPAELVGLLAIESADATALLEVLAHQRPSSGGRILIDGLDVANCTIGSIRETLLVAAHDAALFDHSLLTNVEGNDHHPEQVSRAMTAATVDEAAQGLPEGVHTPLGEHGSSLSGGQRQRVALARALAADAPVLVLHDPTSAVDSVTEAAIAQGIRKMRREQCTLLVTSSPVLLSACDRVLILQDGRITGDGTHAEHVLDHPGYRDAVLS